MKLKSERFSLRILLAIVLCATASFSAAAEKVNLDPIAERLAVHVRKAGTKLVAVADFLDADGQPSDLGWYLASKLSDKLQGRSEGFRLLNRGQLLDSKVTTEDIASAESLKRIADSWGVAAVVIGTVAISAQHYLVTATLHRASDGLAIVTLSQSVPHTQVLDLLSPAGLDAEARNPELPGANGVDVPACAHCPNPEYSEEGRRAGITSAWVILTVTVSRKGNAIKIKRSKDAGYGFTEKAIEVVSDWKFRPAGRDGTPVPVIVPVEVRFSST